MRFNRVKTKLQTLSQKTHESERNRDLVKEEKKATLPSSQGMGQRRRIEQVAETKSSIT